MKVAIIPIALAILFLEVAPLPPPNHDVLFAAIIVGALAAVAPVITSLSLRSQIRAAKAAAEAAVEMAAATKADVAVTNGKADVILEKTDGHLSKLTEQLEVANKKIAEEASARGALDALVTKLVTSLAEGNRRKNIEGEKS